MQCTVHLFVCLSCVWESSRLVQRFIARHCPAFRSSTSVTEQPSPILKS